MKVEISQGVATVTDIETLDTAGSDELVAHLNRLSWAKVKALLLDVRSVSSIDTAGLATLVRIYSRMETKGIELSVLASPIVRRHLAAVGMDSLFALWPHQELASWRTFGPSTIRATAPRGENAPSSAIAGSV